MMGLPLEDFSEASLHGITIYLFILAFCGISFNILVIVLFAINKVLQTPMNTLLVNLTCSDLMVSTLGTTVAFVLTCQRSASIYHDQHFCNYYGFITFLGGENTYMYFRASIDQCSNFQLIPTNWDISSISSQNVCINPPKHGVIAVTNVL